MAPFDALLLQVELYLEVKDESDFTVYLCNAAYSKSLCERLSGDTSPAEIARLILKRRLATELDAQFAVYLFEGEGRTVEVRLTR